MSLHFQIDIAFDFKENSPTDIISGLESLSNNLSLTDQQRKSVPKILEREIKAMKDNLSFFGRDIYYFKKHYRSTKNGIDTYKWTFQFRTMLSDDIFYEECYPFLAWLALLTDTNGFVGYIEEFDAEPRLLYFDNGQVIIRESADKEIKYKYADFDVK
jgi:hypothetical protein